MRRIVLASCAVLCAGGVAVAAPVPPSGTLDLSTDADAVLAGETKDDWAGWAVSPAGDVNGDGKQDLLVAAPKADPNGRADAGTVYVVFGPAGGLPAKLGELGTRGFRIDGAAPGDRAGTAVAPAGDVNGDGRADLLVGAPHTTDRGSDPEGTGAAYLILGRPGAAAVDLADPAAAMRFSTGVAGDQTGVSVATVPDMDGDGRPEPLIGAARADEDRGDAFVLFSSHLATQMDLAKLGDSGLRIIGPAGGRAGLAVAGIADMNGDGRGEIAIGAPQVRNGPRIVGQGFVVFGRATPGAIDLAALGGQGFVVNGEAEDQFLGLAVAGLPDMTGDGIPDVAFGAPGADRNQRALSGSVHVVAGKASADAVVAGAAPGFRLDGAAAGDGLGASVTAAGDVNGDGLADLAAAAPFSDALSRDGAGGVYVVFGAKTPQSLDGASLGSAGYRFAGAAANGFLRSVAAVGDLDGDGTSELLAGAHGASAAYVVLGTKPAPATPPDPGVIEERNAGCVAADNVEMLIDDSGSMEESDPQLLRRQAVELVIAKPRSQGEVLGAYEFGSIGDQLFAPQEILPRGDGSNQADLFKALEDKVGADNEGTDYNLAFTGAANDNPAAQARIFVTDGEHNEGDYLDGHRGGPPTYVIGLNIGTKGEAAQRLRRIATETKARYYPGVTAQQIQSVVNRIDSRLNCDIELDSDVDTLTDEEPTGDQTADLDSDAHSYDVDVSWGEAADTVVPAGVELLGRGDRVLTELSGNRLRHALLHPGRTLRVGDARVRVSRGATSFGMRISGKRAQRLRVSYRMTKFKGRGARVTSQIAQSRRRR